MIPSLALYLALAGYSPGEPPTADPGLRVPGPHFEDLDFLYRIRRAVAFMDANIKQTEWFIAEFSCECSTSLGQQLLVAQMQRDVEWTRVKLHKWRKCLRELESAEEQWRQKPRLVARLEYVNRVEKWQWELYPRPVAPMPREKK